MDINSTLEKSKQIISESDDAITVYLIEKCDNKPSKTDVNRIAGNPIGVSSDRWPDFNGKPMVHVLTLDLNTTPDLKKKFPDDVRAVALFISDLMENEAYEPGTKETEVLLLKESDINTTPAMSANEGNTFITHEVKLPKALFREDIYELDENDPVCELFNSLSGQSMAGGEPIWLQSPEHEGDIILQIKESLLDINLGDQGTMYVFKDTAFFQCA